MFTSCISCVGDILLKAGADPRIRDGNGKVPADVAMDVLAEEQMAELLLKSHLDMLSPKDKDYRRIKEQLDEATENLHDMRALNDIV